MTEYPNYIPRGGEVAWAGPSSFTHARLYVFAVKADGTLVHELLTRYIGRPSQELGAPLDVRGTSLDHVFFVFLDSERVQDSGGSGSEGRQHEHLFAIVVPGLRREPEPRLVLYAPYVYASDTPGWRAEREIYGYPQQLGDVQIQPERPALPDSLVVTARAIERFAPDAMSEDLTIVRIERKPGTSRLPQTRPVPPGMLAEWIAESLGVEHVEPRGHGAVAAVPQARRGLTAADASFLERAPCGSAVPPEREFGAVDLVEALKGSLPMLFLKQFRDIAHSHRACYQAIVEAAFTTKGNVTAIPLKDYQLTLTDRDSAPIRRELGIRPGTVDVESAFMIELGALSLGEAKVISNPYWNPAFEVAIPSTISRLPRYVDRGGEAVWRQPSLLFRARIYGFGVTVPVERQDVLLKEFINDVAARSNSTYGSQRFELSACPGLNMVMLLFVEYERIVSGNDEDRRLGGTAYREFLAMQLALSRDDEFPELDWFIPFIYLDTDAPRLCGREIYGYPKQLGRIEEFRRYQSGKVELDPAETLELSATVIHRASNHTAALESVIRVDGPRDGPPAITGRYLSALDMLTDLLKDVPGDHGIANALAFGGIGNVFLKQFRAAEKPERACYQAVCKTDTMPGKFHGGGCVDPGGYRITIQNHASEPLFRYLTGTDAGGSRDPIIPVFAYWLDLDFELSIGRVIANPLEAPFVPDLSRRTTPPGTSGAPRMVRRSRQLGL